jgi:hypothetical protein
VGKDYGCGASLWLIIGTVANPRYHIGDFYISERETLSYMRDFFTYPRDPGFLHWYKKGLDKIDDGVV